MNNMIEDITYGCKTNIIYYLSITKYSLEQEIRVAFFSFFNLLTQLRSLGCLNYLNKINKCKA